MRIRDRPLLTDIYSAAELFQPEAGSAYIYGNSAEDRSNRSKEWEQKAQDVGFVQIIEQDASTFTVKLDDKRKVFSLRSGQQLTQFWRELNRTTVYLDITGLVHAVWAPLLKAALAMRLQLMAVYVEPIEYRFSAAPTEGEIFDLSDKIAGIAPIPGFASLVDVSEENVCFVPLLGFEGTRFAYIIEQVQPPGGKTVPVVGAPGFRPEYPFYTYHGNRSTLVSSRAWRNVRFAVANDPFSVFYVLQEIAESYPRDLLKIAPIGTKPHALGAVLYALVSRRNVELVYDHPIRKKDRTEGASRLLVYHISAFAAT
jgi:hypothetical protein